MSAINTHETKIKIKSFPTHKTQNQPASRACSFAASSASSRSISFLRRRSSSCLEIIPRDKFDLLFKIRVNKFWKHRKGIEHRPIRFYFFLFCWESGRNICSKEKPTNQETSPSNNTTKGIKIYFFLWNSFLSFNA